jgi:hypothetical protein
MNNVYDMVVTDAPRRDVEVNYQVLEERVESETNTATIFGVVPPDESENAVLNPVFNHPYRPSDLANELGFDHYQPLNDTLDELADESGIDIRRSNNTYHVAFFSRPTPVRQYSEDALQLLEQYLEDGTYEFDLPPSQLEATRVNNSEQE